MSEEDKQKKRKSTWKNTQKITQKCSKKKQTTAATKNVVEVDVVTKRDELESFSDAEGNTKNDVASQEDGAIEFRLNAFD